MPEPTELDIAALYYVTRQVAAALDRFLAVPAAVPSEREPLHRRAVLRDVLQTPGSAVSQIAKRLDIAQSLVSATVAWGRERGLLRTGTDPADRRRTLVFPTEALGAQFGKALAEPARVFLDPLLKDLDPADRAGFDRALARLREYFKAAEEQSRDDEGTC